jgi:hypothetical protein
MRHRPHWGEFSLEFDDDPERLAPLDGFGIKKIMKK